MAGIVFMDNIGNDLSVTRECTNNIHEGSTNIIDYGTIK